MKLVTTFFIMALAMVLMAAGMNATVGEEEEEDKKLISVPQNSISSPGKVSRFLATTNPRAYNCRRNPSICLTAGSPGPDCCRNKCVNLKTDHQNCGACGYNCKFTTDCCRGQCVYLAFDKRHCGGCNKRCDKGEYCIYGFCNYA